MMGASASMRTLASSGAKLETFGGPAAQTIVITGDAACGYMAASKRAAQSVAQKNPSFAEFSVYTFDTRSDFKAWLGSTPGKADGRPTSGPALSHTTSPFIYFRDGAFIGGNDKFQEFIRSKGAL